MSLVSRTALTLLAGLVAVPMTPVTHTSPSISPVASHATPVAYDATEKEFYLAADQTTWIRPGYVIKVNSVTIGADRKPVVDVTITDSAGQPIDRLGVLTPGPAGTSFIVAWWDPASRYYTAYTTRSQTSPITGVTAIQAGTDTGGKYTDLETGHFKYTFGTALPAGFDMTKTTTIGIYGRRVMPADVLDGKLYTANLEYDFRPDGAAVVDKWDKINQATSCNNCHDPLSAHGGSRQDVKLCVLCHQPQSVDPDTGNTVDFKVMVHKIHAGEHLPSVVAGTPYQIIGNAQSLQDYSTVAYPQDIRNCANCHEGTVAASKPTQAAVWYTYPSRAACGSCHDNINWTTGANHAAGQQINDASCSNCHDPVQDAEWDASVPGAHTVEYKSKQLYGLVMKIVSVTQTAPGQKPVVKYQITDRNGKSMDPRPFDTLRFTLGGPTTDYSSYISEDAQATTTFDGTTATYTFQASVPATAKNTWMLTCDVELTVPLKQGDGKPDNTNFTESPLNPIFYIAMTDKTAVPRRTIVDIAKCNVCHDHLGAHGGQRLVTQGCVVCHNPVNDDSSQRPASAGKPESIDMRRMIHRIHTGDLLAQDYTVYGHGGRAVNFNEVRFPGDRRDCAKCHTSITTAEVPTGATLNVVTQRDFFSPQGPGTAACTGCHDSRDVAAHALINTAYFPGSTAPAEACGTCHGTGATYAVDVVHAR